MIRQAAFCCGDRAGKSRLFRFHKNPNPDCPVGRNIHALLDDMLEEIQDALENEMKRYTLADLDEGIEHLIKAEAGKGEGE